MAAQVELLLPMGEIPAASGKSGVNPRVRSLEGLTVAVFSNSWQCMVTIADELKTLLPAKFGVKEVIRYDSPLTLPMPDASLNAAVAACDVAIVGMGT